MAPSCGTGNETHGYAAVGAILRISGTFSHDLSVTAHSPESEDPADLRREWQVLRQIDPIAREVLAATDAWDACAAANRTGGVLVDDLTWMPHGGQLYVAWAELTDLFEIGETSLESAHEVVRQAASRWLSRPEQPDAAFLSGWLEETLTAIEQAAGGARP